jgi:hypothetical protein
MTAPGTLGEKTPPERSAAFWSLALLVFVGSLVAFAHLASLHRICNYRNGDFYGSYAPDAMRVAAGLFPESVFQGPGYPTALALLRPITGDLFTAGKWISVISAALAGLLAFALFRELFGDAVGLGAQMLLVSGAVFCTLATEPVTDMLFLVTCLAALVVFLTPRLRPAPRIAGSAALAGLAFLTRYNGVFLVATFLLALLPVNVFAKTWTQRLRLLALWGLIFLSVTAPWFYANRRHRGAAFYNENYLNIAQEFYGEDFRAAPNKDGLDNIRSRFHSFGDVVRYDPMRIATRYPMNLAMSIRKSLRPLPVAVCAAVGLVLVLWSRKTKGVIVLLLAGALYFLLMALNHFEPRYYLFVTALYTGFGALAIRSVVSWVAERMSFTTAGREAAFASALLLVAVPLALASVRQLRKSYAEEPREIFGACDYLRRRGIVNAPILARKPHLAFVCGQKDVFLPNLDSEEDLERWIQASGSAFLVIGSQEIRSRPALASWTVPDRRPEWLRLAWSEGGLSLFEIVPTTSPPAATEVLGPVRTVGAGAGRSE